MFDDIIINEDWKCGGRSGTSGCAGRPQEENGSNGKIDPYYESIVWDSCKGVKGRCPYGFGTSGRSN